MFLSWGVWLSLSYCGGLRGLHGIFPHHCALTLSGHETKNTGLFWTLWHVLNKPVMSVNCSPKKNGIKPSFHELQSVAGQISSTWTFPLGTTCHQVFLKINSLFNGKYCPCGKWLGNMRKVHKKKKNPWVKFIPCCAVALEFWDQLLSGVEDRTKPCEKSLFPLHFPRQKSIPLLGKHKVWVIALCRITW